MVQSRVVAVEMESRRILEVRITSSLLTDSMCGKEEEESSMIPGSCLEQMGEIFSRYSKKIPMQPTTSQNFQGW